VNEAAEARRYHHAARLDDALPHYRRALLLDPSDDVLRYDAALCMMQLGHAQEAAVLFQQIHPASTAWQPARAPLAICLRDSHRAGEALEPARQAITTAEPQAWQWMLLGDLQQRTGQQMAAVDSLQRALALDPTLLEAHHLLGLALQETGRYEEAIKSYEVVAAQLPMELINIAQCLQHLGRWESARDVLAQLHTLQPARMDVMCWLAHVHAQLCEFDATDRIVARLIAQLRVTTPTADDVPQPFTFATLPLGNDLHRQLLDHAAASIQAGRQPLPRAAARRHGRPRIGYLSSDLHHHTVGTLLHGFFAAHDRSRFEVHVYDSGRQPASINGAEHIEHVGALSDAELAKRLHEADLDILIDLNGPTYGGRPGALAYRPARMQLGWLGYLSGQQSPWLDGIILDHSLAPADTSWPFSDRVLRLAGSVFPAAEPHSPPGRDRARWKLPHASPVAASFNSSHKLSRSLLGCWTQILREAPDALLLVCLAPQAHRGFLQSWDLLGGDRDRLRLLSPMPAEQYLECMASCDLFLDAFNYQAGATAIDAASAGLPLLTCPGELPLSRLGSSVNRQLGMPELICNGHHDYVQRAVTLLRNPAALSELRQRVTVRNKDSALHSAARAATDLQALYQDLLGE